VSVSLRYQWRSGLLLAPCIILVVGLLMIRRQPPMPASR
jgi:hypothetical protein